MYCPYCGVANPPGSAFCRACGKQMPAISTTIKCPHCGADGQEFQLNCTKCGKELPRGMKIDPISGATATQGAGGAGSQLQDATPASTAQPMTTRPCPICGRPMSIYSEKCGYCSRPEDDYTQDEISGYRVRETEMPVIGGALILVSGVLGLIFGLMLMADVASVDGYGSGGATCCSGLFALFGLIAIAGSFSALGRKSGAFAIIGGIFGLLSIGFLLGSVLALIGIILVAISYNEFQE